MEQSDPDGSIDTFGLAVGAACALYGVSTIKRFQNGDPRSLFLLSSSVSLFDPEITFLRPRPRSIAKPARAGAVKVGRRTNLSTRSALARPYLDSSEHDGPLDGSG